MKNWLKPEVKYRIVEAKSSKPLPELTTELKDSLRMLKTLPAFEYLLQRMQLEQAEYNRCLQSGFQLPEAQLHHLQALHYAFGRLEQLVNHLTSTPAPTYRDAMASELGLFELAQANVDLVGA